MGRVKTAMVKKSARKIMEEYGDHFTDDFEENKKVLNKIVDVNKKIRNKIAGEIVRLKKKNKAL